MNETIWVTKKILIWGKTKPELSKSYKELVCTGGVFEDTKRFVRIFPVPLRFLNDEKVFKKYQWIECPVAKSFSDSRPESYKIDYSHIKVLDTISSANNWQERKDWIFNENTLFDSVEDLQSSREENGTSLGIIKPKEIIGVKSEKYSMNYRSSFWNTYKAIQNQTELDLYPEKEKVNPIPPPEVKFKVQFNCNDPRCQKIHSFTIFDWEVHAYYFRQRFINNKSEEESTIEVKRRLIEDIFSDKKDTHFFLGNINQHPQNFTIVGLWYPKVDNQISLF